MKMFRVFLSCLGLPLIILLCSLSNRTLAAKLRAIPLSTTLASYNADIPFQPSPLPSLPPQGEGNVPPSSTHVKEKAYYVAPYGNDNNPGTWEMPWRTVQKAADTLVAGDTVYLRQGVYSERVRLQNTGEPGKEIIYMAYPGEIAVIDGEKIPLPDDLVGLFEIVDQRYIRINGLHVSNSGPYADNAAVLIVNSEYITVENSTTFNTASSGVGVWNSREIVIANNKVERAGIGGGQECITLAGSSDFEVQENLVIDCQKEGIDVKDGSFHGTIVRNVVDHPRAVGIYVDAWDKPTHDITVSRNIVFGSVESSGFTLASEMGGLLTNIRLENNLAYRNYTYGIEVSRCCSGSHPMEGIFLINNTLYRNGVDWGGGIIQDNHQAENVLVRNNIVSQNLTFQIAVAADVPAESATIDHNLIDGYRGYEDEVYGEDYLEGDAGFVDPAMLDLHLTSTSIAIDQGSQLAAPSVDFDGDLRPVGNGYDIGADEWQGKVYLPIVGKMDVFLRGLLFAIPFILLLIPTILCF
ncbi:MAG: hypothetical protein DDG59_03230 [Anaerolineae bacterium]|nr:MAG: hypothetical protein DDG59_03230 [Anaerolineae bacterium]